jgi:hypothetical protein
VFEGVIFVKIVLTLEIRTIWEGKRRKYEN